MTTDRWIRVSDQDRQSAFELFSEAYAVGRLSREDLDERVAAAYSAKTYGELRDLASDLPRPAPTGLSSETVASCRAPQRASRCLVSVMIWMFFALVLAAGLAGLANPVAVWVAAIPVPIALLLTPRSASASGAAPARERNQDVATANAPAAVPGAVSSSTVMRATPVGPGRPGWSIMQAMTRSAGPAGLARAKR
jgi:hypothetical protein